MSFGKGLRKTKAVGKWLITGEKGGSETGYLCLVPFGKLQLSILPGTFFQEMLQPD